MKVLITGGAGFIGSTVASACLDAGHEVVVLDDFSTGMHEYVLGRPVYEGDVGDRALLDQVFTEHRIDAVVHCAAKIVVPESVADPLDYYENNVAKTITLLQAMDAHQVPRLLFSSSASIYATDEKFQVTENSPLDPGSPYATTKFMVEYVLRHTAEATGIRVMSLRYFNPIGADPQFRTGLQTQKPSHVLGKMIEAWQNKDTFTVTGVDWPTRDGSGIRDYIHVWDLALAHVAALEKFDTVTAEQPYQVVNLGTGKGATVKELVQAFEAATGEPLTSTDGPSRPGDVAGAYTVSSKARDVLGWEAQLTEADGIRDALAWLPRRRELLGY